MESKFQKKVEEIKKKVGKTSLYIGRIPEKTKTEFKKLAEEEFEDDYGMCLKWLMDFRSGLLSNPNEVLNEKIELLTEQVRKLMEMANQKPEKKKRKMLSGKEFEKEE